MPSAIDKSSGKWIDEPGLIRWLDRHQIEVERYLDSRYLEMDDRAYNLLKFIKDPYLGYILIHDTMYSDEEKIAKVMTFIKQNSFVCPVVGRKGAGKTATVLWIFEILHKLFPKLKFYWLDINPNLPRWIDIVSDWDQVDDDGVVCVEESAIKYFSRDAMSKESKDMSKMLFISRHRGLRIFFNYQTLQGADVNIHRLADAFLIKPFQMIELADLTENTRTRRFFKYVSMMCPTQNNQTLFTMGDEWIKFSNPLPSFWSDDISRTYKKKGLFEMTFEIEFMAKKGMTTKQIQKILKPKGFTLSLGDIEYILTDPKKFRKEFKKHEA